MILPILLVAAYSLIGDCALPTAVEAYAEVSIDRVRPATKGGFLIIELRVDRAVEVVATQAADGRASAVFGVGSGLAARTREVALKCDKGDVCDELRRASFSTQRVKALLRFYVDCPDSDHFDYAEMVYTKLGTRNVPLMHWEKR